MNLNQTKPVGIIGLGHYLPDQIIDNQYFVERGLDTSDEWISSRSGIKTRHIAADSNTSDLAYQAAIQAISDSSISSQEIDFIIVATATPDHSGFPSTACIVQKKLQLSRNIPAFDITVACSGFTYALGIANSYIQTGMGNYGLIIGAETLSSVVNWADRSTCVLFGDGAGAAIIGPVSGKGILAIDQGANGNFSDILTISNQENRESFQKNTSNVSTNTIFMDGPAVFKQGIQCVQQSFESILAKSNILASDIDFIVSHQANKRILTKISDRFNIPIEKFLINIERVGNTSAASIPLVLSENKDQFKSGDIIYLIGFGAGFTWCGILLEWR